MINYLRIFLQAVPLFCAIFLSATMYYWWPRRVAKAAITKDGTPMVKKITINKMGYSAILSML